MEIFIIALLIKNLTIALVKMVGVGQKKDYGMVLLLVVLNYLLFRFLVKELLMQQAELYQVMIDAHYLYDFLQMELNFME